MGELSYDSLYKLKKKVLNLVQKLSKDEEFFLVEEDALLLFCT